MRENRHHPAELQRTAPTGFLDFSAMPEGAQFREHTKQNLAVEVLRTTGQVQLAAFGYSMLPSLWPGDLLTVEARPLAQTGVGDVVLFARLDRFFIHRVLQIEKGRLITRGDAMPTKDAPVSAEELLGVVTRVQRADGRSAAIREGSPLLRLIGLSVAYSAKLRSLALRWHARRYGPVMDIPAVAKQDSTR